MKLSVIFPTYNYAEFLLTSLKSIKEALIEDAEVLVINDGSTDRTREVIEEIVGDDPRFIVTHNEENFGVNACYNMALEKARGTYFSITGSDDFVFPNFFSESLSALERHPEMGLVCSNYAHFQKPEEVVDTPLIPAQQTLMALHPKDLLQTFRRTRFWIPGHCSLLRTDFARQYGGFREELKLSSDFFLLMMIALNHGAIYIPKPLAAYRIHEKAYSARCRKRKSLLREAHMQCLELLKEPEYASSRKLFKKSTVFKSIFKEHFWYLLFKPRYWDFFPPLLGLFMRRSLRWNERSM